MTPARLLPLLLLPILAGCAQVRLPPHTGAPAPAAAAAPEPAVAPAAIAPAPPRAARTAEQFDTTTPEERAAAAARGTAGGTLLGETVASLGNPAEPGFWLVTPLVASATTGRVVSAATGQAVEVELRPSGGAEGAGSELSLAAIRLLGVPLTDLVVLRVYR
ncbi:hypothetical protein ACRDNQ_02805 [Palleronia sp. KMU-117]|uniref:hypothetical protein n=1 Tax=Palleronia sp. KMU-117 TaxID=3434108 RepID=UPI003D7204A5